MSAKAIFHYFFRKARVEKGLPVREPNLPGLHVNELRSRRAEQLMLQLPSPVNLTNGCTLSNFTLTVGGINNTFANYMKTTPHYNASFISAWDPYVNSNGDIPNEENHKRLKNYLETQQLLHFEAVATGVNQLGWYKGQRPCFVIFNIPKFRSDSIADEFHQNTYVRVPNPMGWANLELRQPVHKPYLALKNLWLSSLKGAAYEAAVKLSSESLTQIMAAPSDEELHWLLPHTRDLNKPWPLTNPSGEQRTIGTEWDRLSRLHKAINLEVQ